MNNKFKEFKSIEEMATDLGITNESAVELQKEALKYCKGKRISHYTKGLVSGFHMMTFVIKGAKSSNTLKQGYQLVYVHNLDYSDCSELGDAYIVKRGEDFYRAG